MNLKHMLAERAAAGEPVRVGVIGAGAFGTMFLAQARRTAGLHVVGVADLDAGRARAALARTGWPVESYGAATLAGAVSDGTTYITTHAAELFDAARVEVIVEATGSPRAGIAHALDAFAAGCHVVMVTVEADAVAGPLLARRAADAGVIYSLAYGDQPALICELVDWARTSGFEVVAAGKGTRYLPVYHASTPETVWGHYGFTEERAAAAGFNSKMFNSFLDGTKSAIEMAAVANATGLRAAAGGLVFPPASTSDLPSVLRPQADGGTLADAGLVEVVSSLRRDGSEIESDLRWGVYVVFRADDDYVAGRLADYGMVTDDSGRYAALYRPYHLIGLELGVSVASVALRREATGVATAFVGDAVAVAKRDLDAGETLDGEGGYTVWGRLQPAAASIADGAVPIGLAQNVTLGEPVAAGEVIRWEQLAEEPDQGDIAYAARRQLERTTDAVVGA
jgi:predicted homoserine dehydrogenase-like protein